ncbi:MAG: sugar phosphate isomerase/epimerase family protein [Chloroflexota bacterium]
MKLGYSSWSMPMLSVDEQIRATAEIGFQGIELICIERSSTDVDTLDPAERRRIRKLLDASGLALPALHASVNPIDPDPAVAAKNIARLRRSIDLAVDIADPSGPPAIVLMGYGRPETYEQDRGRLVAIFRELAEYGDGRGVKLALELHVGQAIDRPERVLWLLEHIDHPGFRLNLDTSHLDVMGYSVADSVRPLVGYAVHTHVKDQRGRYPNHEYLTPGDGDYDYVTYLKEMATGGYRGFVTGEISLMVQRKPGYDPVATARQTYQTLAKAFTEAGLPLE